MVKLPKKNILHMVMAGIFDNMVYVPSHSGQWNILWLRVRYEEHPKEVIQEFCIYAYGDCRVIFSRKGCYQSFEEKFEKWDIVFCDPSKDLEKDGLSEYFPDDKKNFDFNDSWIGGGYGYVSMCRGIYVVSLDSDEKLILDKRIRDHLSHSVPSVTKG